MLPRRPYSLLVQAIKKKGVVIVSAIWQIYLNDIEIDESAHALNVFKAFVEKYGVYLKTPNGLTKMVTYDVVSSLTTNKHGKWDRTFNLPENVFDAEDCRVSQNPEIFLNKWARQLNVTMHITLLYTINLSNYLHDLSSHQSLVS